MLCCASPSHAHVAWVVMHGGAAALHCTMHAALRVSPLFMTVRHLPICRLLQLQLQPCILAALPRSRGSRRHLAALHATRAARQPRPQPQLLAARPLAMRRQCTRLRAAGMRQRPRRKSTFKAAAHTMSRTLTPTRQRSSRGTAGAATSRTRTLARRSSAAGAAAGMCWLPASRAW